MINRIDRVEKLLKEEISSILLYKINDPSLGFLTVTSVKVSPDLKLAKIYFSVFDKNQRQNSLDKIVGLTPSIRSELAGRISLKFCPELKFFLDDTLDYVEKIDGLIKKIHKDDNQNEV